MGKLLFMLYGITIYCLIPLVLTRYLFKGVFDKTYRPRLAERFGRLPNSIEPNSIWIHAASVGEVNAAFPLVNRILESSDHRVVMTCVTPTGSAQIIKRLTSRMQHVYAPLDAGWIVKRFFEKLKPKSLVIVETELWPNLIHHAGLRNVPVYFASLRISDQTFRTAKQLQPLCEYVLKDVAAFGTQTEVDSERIVAIGAERTRVHRTGNLKFDAEPPKHLFSAGAALRDCWGGNGRETIILGSSHEKEEQQFLSVYRSLKKDFPRLVGVIVPRHPDRFDSVFEMIEAADYSVVRRSRWDAESADSAEIILVDTMGELMQFYAASDVAVVGGSFAPIGGHNILEPILAGIPVLFGPEMSNFAEISKLVTTVKAGRQVQNWENCRLALSQLLHDSDLRAATVRRGEELLKHNRGSLARTVELLKI